MGAHAPLLALLRRDRLVLVVGMVSVIALAWGWLLAGAGMEMSAVEMTAMAGMDGWLGSRRCGRQPMPGSSSPCGG